MNRKKIVSGVLFCLCLPFLWSDSAGGTVSVGDRAPRFLSRDLQGSFFVFGTSSFGDGACVLSFFTPDCEGCRREIPALEQLVSESLPETNLIFIGAD